MGLFKWLVIKAAGAFGLLPHQRVRRYQVTLFGEPLGTFTLPIGEHMAKPDALLRPVLTPPFRIEFGEDTFYYWAEANPEGGFETILFNSELTTAHQRGLLMAEQLPIIRMIEQDAAVIQRAVICLFCASAPLIGGEPPPSQYGLCLEYVPGTQPLFLTEQDAMMILNDGVLNRKGIKIEFANT